MADSHHYETGFVLHQAYDGKGGDAWDLIRKIQVFLNDVVGNGWTRENGTGDGPGDDLLAEDMYYYDSKYDPGKLHQEHMVPSAHIHGSEGKCFFVEQDTPWGSYSGNDSIKKQARCKTAYFKYSDGVERDSEFFISIVQDITLTGVTYESEFRVGALNLPREDLMYLGGFLGHGTNGGGGYPVAWNTGAYNASVCNLPEDPPFPDYTTNTCIGLTPTTVGAPFGASPWNYATQPGYTGEARCNELEWKGTSVEGEARMKYHFFGGVENGAPYFYCVLEGLEPGPYTERQRSFAHFGFGRVAKIGDYDGGEFYVGTSWNTNIAYAAAPTSNYHCNMFDGKDTRYAPNRSSFLFNNSRTVLDDQDESTLLDVYLFGYSYNNYQKRVYGDTTSGLITPLLTDGGKSTFSYKTELFRNYIRVYDIARDDATYMLVGIPPAYRTVMVPNVQPEQQYTDRDGHTWMIFPLRGKYNDSNLKPSSGDYGLAYRIS